MDFADAITLIKKFPAGHPKIFKGFYEWGICDIETEGYVVLADATSTKAPGFNQLEGYAKNHQLRIDQSQDYLMISTQCKVPSQ
jgi:hypothetical protein